MDRTAPVIGYFAAAGPVAARGVAVAGRDLVARFRERLVVVAKLHRRHALGIAGVRDPGAPVLQDQHGFRRQDPNLLFLDDRSAGVDGDQVRLAEALAGDDHRIVVLEHRHIGDHRVADDEGRRAGRQLGDLGLVERDRDQVRLGAGRRRAEGENERGSEPKARRHGNPLSSGDQGSFRPPNDEGNLNLTYASDRRENRRALVRRADRAAEHARTIRARRRHGRRKGRLRHAAFGPRRRPRP